MSSLSLKLFKIETEFMESNMEMYQVKEERPGDAHLKKRLFQQ